MVEHDEAGDAPVGPRKPRTRISPALMEGEAALSKHWRQYFLTALAETWNVSAASAVAGINPARAYKVRKREPEFARAWRIALLEGYENLELEMLHRLRFGEPRDDTRKFDNASAMRLLALHRETVTRERAMRENEDLVAVRAAIRTKLAQLRREVVARRATQAVIKQEPTPDA
jgi:hypothetical protein